MATLTEAEQNALSFDDQIALAIELSRADLNESHEAKNDQLLSGGKIKQDSAPDTVRSEGLRNDPNSAVAASSSNVTAVIPGDEHLPHYSEIPIRRTYKTNHSNKVTKAEIIRGRDEQHMQNLSQSLQWRCGIYNDDIDPEHECEYYCSCEIHQYAFAKARRYPIQNAWSEAVMYPGEKAYIEVNAITGYGNGVGTPFRLFSSNPYRFVVTPYGYLTSQQWGPYYSADVSFLAKRPSSSAYTTRVLEIVKLNNNLNHKAQTKIDEKEPKTTIWDEKAVADLPEPVKKSGLKKLFGKSKSDNSDDKVQILTLRSDIESEEVGRWPDEETRNLVRDYQKEIGMYEKVSHLRQRSPIQYLHLLRAGYFEPIPTDWCQQDSNPLKFRIDGPDGWRGITPTWRGFEDTAEERLYWVLNHRKGAASNRIKPDPESVIRMAQERMARAVEPPPQYYSDQDVCHVQHFTKGYSPQVMPPPYTPTDEPFAKDTDDTMVLLDVSGSMDMPSRKPLYKRLLIENYIPSAQPRNKDVAKSILRRFTDAMAAYDPSHTGYDLVTFSTHGSHIGSLTPQNFSHLWSRIPFGGGTRIMTGWQKVKTLHFSKHPSYTFSHPDFGPRALPGMPRLRLLVFLDGEASDMDEFELDLLDAGKWAHVTVFLIGAEGCVHHHRHANELQRIADANGHVAFVDAQGNTPERLVTHEILKRHLGVGMEFGEFVRWEGGGG